MQNKSIKFADLFAERYLEGKREVINMLKEMWAIFKDDEFLTASKVNSGRYYHAKELFGPEIATVKIDVGNMYPGSIQEWELYLQDQAILAYQDTQNKVL